MKRERILTAPHLQPESPFSSLTTLVTQIRLARIRVLTLQLSCKNKFSTSTNCLLPKQAHPNIFNHYYTSGQYSNRDATLQNNPRLSNDGSTFRRKKYGLVFEQIARLMLRRRRRCGANGNGRRRDLWSLNPSRRPFPVKKRINTELFIDRGKDALYTKDEEGSDQGDRIKKYRTSQKRVEYWRENKSAGVKTAAACLGELTTDKGKGS